MTSPVLDSPVLPTHMFVGISSVYVQKKKELVEIMSVRDSVVSAVHTISRK